MSKSVCDKVTAHITCVVGSRAVHLSRVFGREASATNRCISTICIDDDLSSCCSRVTPGATQYKGAGWIDQIFCILIQQGGIYNRGNDFLHDNITDHILCCFCAVLGGNNNGIYSCQHTIIVFSCYLCFSIRFQPWCTSAHFFQLFGKSMCCHDGIRHQFFSFITGITEHDTLVSCRDDIMCDGTVDFRRLRVDLCQNMIFFFVADFL